MSRSSYFCSITKKQESKIKTLIFNIFNHFYVLSVSIKFVFNFPEQSEEKETVWKNIFMLEILCKGLESLECRVKLSPRQCLSDIRAVTKSHLKK